MKTSNEQFIFDLEDLPISELLLESQPKLLTEFLVRHPEFNSESELKNVMAFNNPNGNNRVLYSDNNVWKVGGVKSYGTLVEFNRPYYPTGFMLADMFGDDCHIASYSILEPKSVIYRHTDEENRQALKIRIHIPLSIPDGDVGLEVDGNIKTWDAIFAFNTQKLHGAWNDTEKRRLVFILDVNRKRLGLPPGTPWTPDYNKNAARFEKTEPPHENN